jgi:hypothetical protein
MYMVIFIDYTECTFTPLSHSVSSVFILGGSSDGRKRIAMSELGMMEEVITSATNIVLCLACCCHRPVDF